MSSANFQHRVLQTIRVRFFSALREQFRNKIAKLETRVYEIDNMRRPQEKHRLECADKTQLIQTLQEHLQGIELLFGTP